ncbi:MAG: hypothetical protein KA397_03045 [Paludibacteraceae bacterium]|nr:hypothetical protein [Paludibacteraceae bacterium]MBP6284224.1 hypothetical protein [Paludibacteraceae bacterium]
MTNNLTNILFTLKSYCLLNFHKKKYREKKYLSFDEIKSIVFVYYIDDYSKYDTVYQNIKDFTAQGKTVFSILFVKNGVPFEEKRINMRLFSQKDCSWLSVPNNDVMTDLLELSADVLIDLSLTDILPIQYAIANSPIPCKVGRVKDHTYLYDLMLEMKDDELTETELLKTITYYLTHIQS